MTDVPHEVLSEHFQEQMEGCRLVAAVFLTYQFDPGFFEQEVLPVFIDMPLSHSPTIRLLQLEDALRGIPGGIAVYYDANGLSTGDAGSARLDIRRIPIQHKKGIFHPKNAFVLIEEDDAGPPVAVQLLDTAKAAVLDRHRVYGPPQEHFARTVGMVNSLFASVLKRPLTTADWARIMLLDKLARDLGPRPHPDNAVDLAGYAACLAECNASAPPADGTP